MVTTISLYKLKTTTTTTKTKTMMIIQRMDCRFANDDEPLVASVEHFKGGETKVAGMAIIQKSEIDREGPWVVFVSEKGRGKQ